MQPGGNHEPSSIELELVLADVLERRHSGQAYPDDQVIEAYPHLMPELGERLAEAARVVQTIHRAQQTTSSSLAIRKKETQGEDYQLDIPGYHVEEEIGRGGQAVVYTAIQYATGRRVAIKFLGGGMLASPAERKRIDREVEILASLHHPHVVKIIDRGQLPDGARYVVTDYILGQSLDRYINQHNALRMNLHQGDLLKLLLKVAQATAAAHDLQVIHRDLKPSNILVDEYSQPHLLDFGLARRMPLLSSGEETIVTTAGQFVGSMPWASPEQAGCGDGAITPASDVYSLGVIFYYALTGRFPYAVDGPLTSVLHNIEHVAALPTSQAMQELRGESDSAEPISLEDARIVEQMNAVLQKMLAKAPSERYENASQVAEEIERVLEGRHTLAYQYAPAAPRKHARAMAFGIYILLAVAVISVGYILPAGNSQPMSVTTLPADPVASKAPADAVAFRGRSFKLFEGRYTWDQARAIAARQGGKLAVIKDQSDLHLVADIFKVGQGRRAPIFAWLGMRSDGEVVETMWGKPVLFRSLHPTLEPTGEMLPVVTDGVWWVPRDPNELFHCLVEWEGVPSATVSSYQGGAAKTLEVNGKTFGLFNEKLKWIQARQRCEEMGGVLATIDSPELEQDLLTMLQSVDPSATQVWSGGRMYNGQLSWGDGTPVQYTNWAPGFPVPYANAVALTKEGWRTVSFNSKTVRMPFVCMWRHADDDAGGAQLSQNTNLKELH